MSQKIIPQHVAIIMDGNGRWALERGISRSEGHKSGGEAVRDIVKTCLKRKIKTLSLFAFGQDNWKRPPEEVDCLMQLFQDFLEKEGDELHAEGVRLSFIGDKTELDETLRLLLESAENLTRNNAALNLNVFINYSGRWDMVQATQSIARRVVSGELSVDEIDEDIISSLMATHEFCDPDLFIRTSGEQRISNFLLWQLVYAEFYFTPVYWPDFTAERFEEALEWFALRERRFGKTSKQLTEAEDA